MTVKRDFQPTRAWRTIHLAHRFPANPENCYHPRQFRVHSGNPDYETPRSWESVMKRDLNNAFRRFWLTGSILALLALAVGRVSKNSSESMPTPTPTPAPGPAFFVAPPPLGDDSNTGTDAAPFATP